MSERKKVFIIDDEVDLCLLMKTYFLRKHYAVSIAHLFSDALPQVKESQPDFIFITTTVCQNPEEDMQTLKAAAPFAEIRLIKSGQPNQF
jgi:DNA-binding response OmpR family regulator